MNKDTYEDIINLPRYEPKYHTRMTIDSRAAQFAPFSALTGYAEAVKEVARLTDERIAIDEELEFILNNKLQIILENIKDKPEITITYFVHDKNKTGGKYITISGNVHKIDMTNGYIELIDKTRIPINEIINITGYLFKQDE